METEEVAKVFRDYGLSETEMAPVVSAICGDHKSWVDFMMRFELGLEEPDPNAPRSAVTIAASYIVGGLIPLAPYMLLSDVATGLYYSVGITLLALAVFGWVKGRFTGISLRGRAADGGDRRACGDGGVRIEDSKPEASLAAVEMIRGHFAGPIGVYAETGDWQPPNWVLGGLPPAGYLQQAITWADAGARLHRRLLRCRARAHTSARRRRAPPQPAAPARTLSTKTIDPVPPPAGRAATGKRCGGGRSPKPPRPRLRASATSNTPPEIRPRPFHSRSLDPG